MKRVKFRIKSSSAWSDEKMIEELKKNTQNFEVDGDAKEETAIVIITIRKVPKGREE
jgi:hypothetical protein